MSQTQPASHIWSRTPTADIPGAQWTRWLDSASHPSPYLTPEWALFWVQAWPDAVAEVWQTGDAGLSTVSRRRMGRTWVHALPYGTPGGWLGNLPGDTSGEELLENFVTMLTESDAVEVAVSVPGSAPNVSRWKRTTVASQTWTLDLTGAAPSDLDSNLSDSHRRNIEKGAQHNPVIKPVEDREAAAHLFKVWPVPSAHRSRIVLNPVLAPALASAFALSPVMRWLTAWVGEKPVATSLWLVVHDRAVYVDGATVRDRTYTGVSHYLFHHILNDLARNGVRHFDLGSGPQGKSTAGLVQFKEGWGGTPQMRTEVIYRRPWYHWLRKIV